MRLDIYSDRLRISGLTPGTCAGDDVQPIRSLACGSMDNSSTVNHEGMDASARTLDQGSNEGRSSRH